MEFNNYYYMTLYSISYVYLISNREMIVRFRLDCEHKRVSRSAPRVFNTNSVQEIGTYIQDAHSAPSIKGKSRSASKKRNIKNDTLVDGSLLSCTSSPK